MYAQAVAVLQQEVYDTPLPSCAQQSRYYPLNVLVKACIEMLTGQAGPVTNNDESGLPLSPSVNGLFGVYSMPKAATILATTKKGSQLRSQTMHAIIKRGSSKAMLLLPFAPYGG